VKKFSAQDPPLWFKIIVYIGIAVVAVGLVILVSRNGLIRQYQQTLGYQNELRDLTNEKYDVSVSILERLDIDLQISGLDAGAASVPQISDWYCYFDVQVNDQMLEVIRERGRGRISASVASEIGQLKKLDAEVADIAADYNDAALRFNSMIHSFGNMLSARMLSYQDMELFDCRNAFFNDY
jgi:hypothetical protein